MDNITVVLISAGIGAGVAAAFSIAPLLFQVFFLRPRRRRAIKQFVYYEVQEMVRITRDYGFDKILDQFAKGQLNSLPPVVDERLNDEAGLRLLIENPELFNPRELKAYLIFFRRLKALRIIVLRMTNGGAMNQENRVLFSQFAKTVWSELKSAASQVGEIQ